MMNGSDYVKNIFLRKTNRDKQRKVGASNISNECTRCLADDLLGIDRPQGPYNMGAKIGTAIHEFLENHNSDPTALKEHHVIIGEIPGYGTVGSTTDLYLPDEGLVIDFKTTDRDKLKWYKRANEEEPSDYELTSISEARVTIERYQRQAQLYALGLENEGYHPTAVQIVFICRDGKITDTDIYGLQAMEYDNEFAHAIFDRAAKLWAWLQEGNDPEQLPSHDHCYFCSNVR